MALIAKLGDNAGSTWARLLEMPSSCWTGCYMPGIDLARPDPDLRFRASPTEPHARFGHFVRVTQQQCHRKRIFEMPEYTCAVDTIQQIFAKPLLAP
jgi:hypothetical protein